MSDGSCFSYEKVGTINLSMCVIISFFIYYVYNTPRQAHEWTYNKNNDQNKKQDGGDLTMGQLIMLVTLIVKYNMTQAWVNVRHKHEVEEKPKIMTIETWESYHMSYFLVRVTWMN